MGKNDGMEQAVERLKKMLLGSTDEGFNEEGFLAAIERIQQEAFMDGYRYAIAILEESMVKEP